MAMQLKTGADLNNMPLSRFVIENLIADPTNNIKAGSKYFNTGTGTLANRERIYAGGKWRSTAYMDDINALQKQLDELDFAGSEEFQTLSGRVLTIEGLFNNGKAKDAEKLGGQLPSYYAEAEIVEQLREDFDDLYKTLNDDTTGVINTWQEVVDFVNEYSGSEDLSSILAGMNTQIADRYTKAESDGRYLPLDGTKAMSGVLEAPKGIKIGNVVISIDNDGNLKIDGNAYATGELGSGQVAGEGGGGSAGGGYTAFDDSISWEDYEDSMADWLLTAYHGKLFNDRIATLENKATKVEVSNLLTSGTKIATIKVDANIYDILAPSTDWSAITNKPTTIGEYGITDAIVYNKDGIDISGDSIPLNHIGYGYTTAGWPRNAVAMSIGLTQNFWAQLQFGNAQMSFRTNVSGTISDWCNVLTNNNYELELNKTYLRLVGGTINGSLIISDAYPIIAFTQNGVRGEGIGMNGGKLVCYNATSTSSYAILHSNNIGEYAFAVNKSVTYTKTHLSSMLLGYVSEETDGVTGDFCILNLPTWTSNSESKYYASQLKFNTNLNKYNGLLLRTVTESTNGDWRTIIDTANCSYFLSNTFAKTDGSNATGSWSINAATATKLQNTVYLWGNAFDGSKSINNQLVLAYDTSIRVKSSYEEDASGLHVFTTFGSNAMYFGYGAYTADWATHIYGKAITFVPKTGTAALEITETGGISFKSIIKGDISFNTGSGLRWKVGEDSIANVVVDATGNFFLGKGGAQKGYSTFVDGNIIYFRSGKNNTTAMAIYDTGTAYFTKGVVLANNIGIQFYDSNTNAFNAVSFNTANTLSIGYGGATFQGYTTQIYGGSIAFLTSAAGGTPTQAMKINESGNVVIGGYSPVLSRKLTVNNGGTFLYAYNSGTSSPDLGTPFEKALLVGYDTFGMQIWTNSNGSSYIQNSYFNGTATAFPIYINPLGGAVNIGSSSSNTYVLGDIIVSGAVRGAMPSGSSVHAWKMLPSNGNLCLQAAATDGTSLYGSISISGYDGVNLTDFKVFSTTTTLKSRVLIGNISDDGVSALRVFGDISTANANIYFSNTGGWSKGFFALDSNGQRIGGLGFLVGGDVLQNIWVGSYDAPWTTFNSTEANFNVLTKFNSSVKIGEATLSYENGALKVDKNFFAEGEVASGKVAEEGTGGNTPSGSGLEIKTFDIASTTENQMVELAHNLGTKDVVVQIYENASSSNYQQVFADVYYVDTAKVAINFGAAQTVPHRVIIMG